VVDCFDVYGCMYFGVGVVLGGDCVLGCLYEVFDVLVWVLDV